MITDIRILDKIRQALYDAKFALEQDLDGADKDKVVKTIREALDLTASLYPGNEENPALVSTLSSSLADPFQPEQPTHVVIKDKK